MPFISFTYDRTFRVNFVGKRNHLNFGNKNPDLIKDRVVSFILCFIHYLTFTSSTSAVSEMFAADELNTLITIESVPILSTANRM